MSIFVNRNKNNGAWSTSGLLFWKTAKLQARRGWQKPLSNSIKSKANGIPSLLAEDKEWTELSMRRNREIFGRAIPSKHGRSHSSSTMCYDGATIFVLNRVHSGSRRNSEKKSSILHLADASSSERVLLNQTFSQKCSPKWKTQFSAGYLCSTNRAHRAVGGRTLTAWIRKRKRLRRGKKKYQSLSCTVFLLSQFVWKRFILAILGDCIQSLLGEKCHSQSAISLWKWRHMHNFRFDSSLVALENQTNTIQFRLQISSDRNYLHNKICVGFVCRTGNAEAH